MLVLLRILGIIRLLEIILAMAATSAWIRQRRDNIFKAREITNIGHQSYTIQGGGQFHQTPKGTQDTLSKRNALQDLTNFELSGTSRCTLHLCHHPSHSIGPQISNERMEPRLAAHMDPSLDTPAMEPPPGVVPNFAEPGGSHALEQGMIVAGAIISAVAVLARLVSSAAARKLLIEDVLMVAASSVDLSSIFYTLSAMCLKVAILVNWLRIFVPAGQRNGTWWTLHVLIWAHLIFYSITALTGIFSCQPRQKIWDPWYVGGNCPVNVKVQHIFISVFNFVSDTAILAMPQRIIWRLQMSRSQKWGLSLLFVIGIGAWISGVARTVYFVKMLENDDAMYNLTGVAIWTVWEMTAGFMVMGAPALPRAFKTLPMSESVASFFPIQVPSWAR
ncbi:hypothetical protein PG997_007170 [Apiospora hydei]|uniref:Rhodopsin domain-containing protein n=1 Tax=Apiospora hydei TaxID=1337664 RepID=A0ABR1WQT9_9PEZI